MGVLAAATGEGSAGVPARDILRYALTSAVLAAAVGLLTAVAGALAAWLVVMHRFPGRDLFTWALALPLAMPAFAVAYGYADLLDVAGPLRTGLREATGQDLPFEIRSTGGAAFVLSAAFYPYVFLAMRAALLNLPGSALEAAGVAVDHRTLVNDYRLGTVDGLVMAVIASQVVARTPRGDQLFAVMAERHVTHMLDHDVEPLLTN